MPGKEQLGGEPNSMFLHSFDLSPLQPGKPEVSLHIACAPVLGRRACNLWVHRSVAANVRINPVFWDLAER